LTCADSTVYFVTVKQNKLYAKGGIEMISKAKVNWILQQHGIDDIYDTSTGSSLVSDLGDFTQYDIDDVKTWLGY